MKRQFTRAVILAAGEGIRVRSLAANKPKCLIKLGDRPIIEWIMEALRDAGIKDIVVVTGFRAQTLKHALGDGSRLNVRLSYTHNPEWTRPNGLSLYTARSVVRDDDTFLTLMSDHLLPSSIIRKVARARTSKCVLAVDTDIAKVFDLSDATKVRLIGGSPVAIGKKLRTYNAIDCGLFRFDRRIFSALKMAFAKGKMTLTDGVKVLIANGDLDVLPTGNAISWIDIDTPGAYKQAQKNLATFAPGFGTGRGSR